MTDPTLDKLPGGFKGMSSDIGSDQTTFKGVNWGKAMMWIFLLSDTFVFSCFLVAYMKVRASVTEPWPYPSEVFGLEVFGVPVPLLLIAIMTFVLITSSGTMALAVKYGYEKNRKMCGLFVLLTAIGGLTFVGMQAFEWSKLIFHDGVRPWGNPFGAEQFGAFFFMITGFHGTHVSIGVIFLFIFARKVFRGDFDTGKRGYFTTMKSDYVAIEILGLYWHFVDLVWVFILSLIHI